MIMTYILVINQKEILDYFLEELSEKIVILTFIKKLLLILHSFICSFLKKINP